MKLSVRLENLVHGQEKLFLVVFVGNFETQDSSGAKLRALSTNGAPVDPNRVWRQVCRTEAIKVDESPKYPQPTIESFIPEFNILQDPMASEMNCSHVRIVLYKVGMKNMESDGSNSTSDLQNQNALCQCIIQKNLLHSKRAVIKVGMTVLVKPQHDIVLNLPSVPQATLGIVLLSSSPMYDRRLKLVQSMKTLPYAEVLYCFRTLTGQALVLEQVYAARYSLTVATSMLELLIQERKDILDVVKKVIKTGLRTSLVTLKTIPKKAAMRDLDNMMVGNQDGTRAPQMIAAGISLCSTY
jgi:hypothetical protein